LPPRNRPATTTAAPRSQKGLSAGASPRVGGPQKQKPLGRTQEQKGSAPGAPVCSTRKLRNSIIWRKRISPRQEPKWR
jgi:hypothetical protein